VRLKASAPSLHIIKADITAEITPIIGTEKQCEELVRYMLEEFEDDPQKIWQKDIFGKSLHDLVREGIQNKLHRMPENAQAKLQETVSRIVNEGSGGLICIII
jgi:stage IV sporulation protein A